MTGTLPKLWTTPKLSDICEINPRGKPGLPESATVSFVPMAAVSEHSGSIIAAEPRLLREVQKGFTPFQEGDVLFAKITPCMENGKAAIARNLINARGYGSTEFHVIRPSSLVLAEWIFALVRTEAFRIAAAAALHGAVGQQRVPTHFLERFRIPLPPLSEQRRLIKILQEAEEIRSLRDEAEATTAELIPRIFLSLFGDPYHNPKHWPTYPISSLAAKYSDGPFGSNLKSSHYAERGVRVVRLQNIGVGKFLGADDAYISEEHFASLAKHECLPGDVLIGTLGEPNLRACILPPEIGKALNKADCVQFRPDSSKVTSAYVCWLLNMPGILRMTQSLQAGQTRSRISMGRLSQLKVPCPPLELQWTFQQAVDEVLAIDALSTSSDSIERAMLSSLSAFAFTGQLTADWRNTFSDKLVIEAHERDNALKEAGVILSSTRPDASQELDQTIQLPSDGMYAELNREQRTLLVLIRKNATFVQQGRYFTAYSLSDVAEGALRKNPQAIEGHLAVLAARGLVISVSREEQTADTGEFVFGNGYRLPTNYHEPHESQAGDKIRMREVERIASQFGKERISA